MEGEGEERRPVRFRPAVRGVEPQGRVAEADGGDDADQLRDATPGPGRRLSAQSEIGILGTDSAGGGQMVLAMRVCSLGFV